MTPQEFIKKYNLNTGAYEELCLKHDESLFLYGTLDEINIAVVEFYPSILTRLAPDDLTDSLINSVPNSVSVYIRNVSKGFMCERMCKAVCYANSYNLRFVPEQYLTAELCIESIKRGFSTLGGGYHKKILERIADIEGAEKVYIEYAKTCPKLLQYVPESNRTREVFLAAFKSKERCGHKLYLVPKKLRDYEMCMAACSCDSDGISCALEEVPVDTVDYELCMTAVKSDKKSIEHVPTAFLTEELCTVYAKTHKTLEGVPLSRRTRELCLMVFEENVAIVKDIPSRYVTQEMLMMVAKQGLLGRIPKYDTTEEMCIEAIRACQHNEQRLTRLLGNIIPGRLQTERVYLEYVGVGGSLKHVSNKSREVCMAAIKRNILNFQHVPEKIMTEEMCCIAAERCSMMILNRVPEHLRTTRVCVQYVKKKRSLSELFWIPSSMRDEEVYIASFKRNMSVVFGLMGILDFTDKVMDEMLKYEWKELDTDRSWVGTLDYNKRLCRNRIIKLCRYAHKKRFTKVMNELMYAPRDGFPLFKRLKTEFDKLK